MLRQGIIHGHPQCLRNTIIVGLPSPIGRRSFEEFGALVPTTGAAATLTGGGGGVCHDIRDFGTVRLANGFAKGDGAFGSFDAFVSKLGTDKALEGMPAFRRAILVVSFANILNGLSSSRV